MKALIFLMPFLLINSCKTSQPDLVTSKPNTMGQTINTNSDCPEGGICTVEVHKNKKLTMLDDGTGALYPEMIEGDAIVVAYTYSKKGPEGTVDGNYSETIHFEVADGEKNFKKENLGLKDVKLVYGKHCFCKGEAGYYLIDNGKLLVETSGAGMHFDLNFKVGKTSQVVSHISEMVKL